VLTIALAVSQELMRALLIQVSRPLAHLVSPPSSGETPPARAGTRCRQRSRDVLQHVLELFGEMWLKLPPKTSMPPQPAFALGNWMAASW